MTPKTPQGVTCAVEFMDGTFDEKPHVIATCNKCGETVKSFGHTDASVTRCLAVMHDGCPNRENNFYVTDDFIG